MVRRTGLGALALCTVIALAVPASADVLSATPSTVAGAVIYTSPPPTGAPAGVSPDVFYAENSQTYYMITTANPPRQYSSTDGVNWTPMSVTLPPGFDWTIVQEGPGSYRLYFAEIIPTGAGQAPPPPCTPGSKRLRYATSTDLQSWSVQPTILVDDVGCGVPHVMKTRDGRYFLYFNKREPVHGVYVGTSSDGLNWTIGTNMVANASQLVDPAPLQMPDGTFLMVASTTGQGGYQELQLLSSTDALTWIKRPTDLYSPPGAGVLDPSVELINGTVRVWFGYAPGGSHADATIASGSIRLGNVKAVKGKKCTAKGAVSGALTCKPVKGTYKWAALT